MRKFLDYSWTIPGLFLDFSRTFSQKICGKVLVSKDYVLEKKQIFLGYIKDLFY